MEELPKSKRGRHLGLRSDSGGGWLSQKKVKTLITERLCGQVPGYLLREVVGLRAERKK